MQTLSVMIGRKPSINGGFLSPPSNSRCKSSVNDFLRISFLRTGGYIIYVTISLVLLELPTEPQSEPEADTIMTISLVVIELANMNPNRCRDVRGRVVSWFSAGTCGFKGTKRGTPINVAQTPQQEMLLIAQSIDLCSEQKYPRDEDGSFAMNSFVTIHFTLCKICRVLISVSALRIQVPEVFVMAGEVPEIDWRLHGILNREAVVQRDNECWAIVGADTAEANYYIRGVLDGAEVIPDMRPSVQHFIDCPQVPSDETGGFVEHAYQEMVVRGVATDGDYPTRVTRSGVVRRSCRHCHHNVIPTMMIQDFIHVPTIDVALIHYLQTEGTLAIKLTCGTDVFDGYEGGVVGTDGIGAGVFHPWEADGDAEISSHYMVLLGCGFDLDVQRPFWLLRNTAGPMWGEQGCMRLDMHMTDRFEEAWIPVGVHLI